MSQYSFYPALDKWQKHKWLPVFHLPGQGEFFCDRNYRLSRLSEPNDNLLDNALCSTELTTQYIYTLN